MRTIKFRGRDIETKEWRYGTVHTYGDGVFISNMELQNNSGRNWMAIAHEVDPETVGQFTGSTDKNGKDIYEGDVGYRKIGGNKEYQKNHGDWWLIEWHNESCGFITTYIAYYNLIMQNKVFITPEQNPYSYRFKEIEIIGNIHDNPELLK